eukprot:6758564-Pyramimonas_sp.AAC.1
MTDQTPFPRRSTMHSFPWRCRMTLPAQPRKRGKAVQARPEARHNGKLGVSEKAQPPNALPSAIRRRARGAHGETFRRVRPIIGR